MNYYLPPFLPRRTRTVVTIHDISWEYYPEFFGRAHLLHLKTVIPWSARRADRVLTVSLSLKNALLERYTLDPDKIVVTPLAADESFHPRDKASSRARLQRDFGIRARFLLCIGNRGLWPRKNLARVVRAFAWLKKRHQIEEKLVVVGQLDSGSRSAFSALDEPERAREVICTGYVDPEAIPDFYSAAEAFVFPSLYEGFGIPVLEAMACGTPVITSNRGACQEVAGDAALLVNPEDWMAIANAMEQVLSDARLSEELRAAGLKRAREFSWSATAARTLAVYHELEGML